MIVLLSSLNLNFSLDPTHTLKRRVWLPFLSTMTRSKVPLLWRAQWIEDPWWRKERECSVTRAVGPLSWPSHGEIQAVFWRKEDLQATTGNRADWLNPELEVSQPQSHCTQPLNRPQRPPCGWARTCLVGGVTYHSILWCQRGQAKILESDKMLMGFLFLQMLNLFLIFAKSCEGGGGGAKVVHCEPLPMVQNPDKAIKLEMETALKLWWGHF